MWNQSVQFDVVEAVDLDQRAHIAGYPFTTEVRTVAGTVRSPRATVRSCSLAALDVVQGSMGGMQIRSSDTKPTKLARRDSM